MPLNHGTGKGWVKQVKGHYHDALYVKKSRVVVWLLETTGGICPHACAHGRRLAERARTRCVWGPSISVCSPGGQPANFYQEHGYSRKSSALISKRWFLIQDVLLYLTVSPPPQGRDARKCVQNAHKMQRGKKIYARRHPGAGVSRRFPAAASHAT